MTVMNQGVRVGEVCSRPHAEQADPAYLIVLLGRESGSVAREIPHEAIDADQQPECFDNEGRKIELVNQGYEN